MKKVFFFFSIFMLSAALSQAQARLEVQLPRISADVIFGNRAPNANEARAMRAEAAGHPRIARAIQDCENSLRSLDEAPDTFGGHKARAQADLKQALMSLRRALYYRLLVDNR